MLRDIKQKIIAAYTAISSKIIRKMNLEIRKSQYYIDISFNIYYMTYCLLFLFIILNDFVIRIIEFFTLSAMKNYGMYRI